MPARRPCSRSQGTAAQNNPKAQQHILDAGAHAVAFLPASIRLLGRSRVFLQHDSGLRIDACVFAPLPVLVTGVLPEIMRLAWTDTDGTARVKGLLALSCALPQEHTRIVPHTAPEWLCKVLPCWCCHNRSMVLTASARVRHSSAAGLLRHFEPAQAAFRTAEGLESLGTCLALEKASSRNNGRCAAGRTRLLGTV